MVARLLFWIFVSEMNIPICLCYLSLGLYPWSNPSLCEICRRCVKCVNDMENLPTGDLFFVRSRQAGIVKMKCCIGDHDQRSFTLGKIKILYAVEIRFLNNKILMDYTHQTLILPLVEWLRLYKYVILLLVEPVLKHETAYCYS